VVKIVGIGGSLRAESYTHQALGIAAQRVEALGAEVEILDLREMKLPALDLMSFEELSDKVVGNISILGGQSNSNSLNQMRVVMRWVHAWVIPEQIAIGQAWKAFDEEGKLLDEKLSQRLDKFAQSLVENTKKLRSIG